MKGVTGAAAALPDGGGPAGVVELPNKDVIGLFCGVVELPVGPCALPKRLLGGWVEPKRLVEVDCEVDGVSLLGVAKTEVLDDGAFAAVAG